MGQAASVVSSLNLERSSRIQVLETNPIIRPDGYALPNYQATSVTVVCNRMKTTGYGEGSGQIAYEKALSEAIERSVLFEFRRQNGRTESSNGWACHFTAALAIDAAIFELIERDVAVSSWQAGGPFYIVSDELWPQELRGWQPIPRPEFSDLKILLSESPNGACVSALLFNDRGNFVAGHASGPNLSDAILSAAAECFRAAHSAIRFEYFNDVLLLHAGRLTGPTQPAAHSLAYAYSISIPPEVAILSASSSEIRFKWQRHVDVFSQLDRNDFCVTLFPVEGRVVARVKNKRYREMVWGPNQVGSNFKNNSPHFVG